MKTHWYNTTKVYQVNQKAAGTDLELGRMKKAMLLRQVGSITGNLYLILLGELQLEIKYERISYRSCVL